MEKIEEFQITSVAEYVSIITNEFPQFALSRGQGVDKNLLPSALRLDESGMRLFSDQQVDWFIEDFKNDSPQYLQGHGAELQNNYEWMVYAQHFGIPTRLLDFTFSHMIALMFAVEKAFEANDEDSSIVWLLNYEYLNEKSIGKKEIVNLSTASIENPKYPCVVTARKINPRVIAQNGLFVLFPKESKPLETVDIADEILKKIIIPNIYSKQILSELYASGMRFNNLYPELTSVSKDILLKNNVMEFYRMEDSDE